jgi:membrane fusion protein (multidrug efflux system)
MLVRFLAISIAVAGAAGCSKEAPPARPAPQVSVITIAPQDVPETFTFVAQTESSQQVDIMARVSGFLDKIAYREGEIVKEGQVLFQIDPKPFQAQLDAARGELLAQQARHTTAAANLARVKPLAEKNALSQSDLDRAQGDFDSSKAAVFSAQAKVNEAELNLGYTTIRSPVTGFSGRALQRQGAYIASQSSEAKLTYVAKVEPMWVNFSVSQNQLAKQTAQLQKGVLVAPKNRDYDLEIVMADGSSYAHRGKINFADPSFSSDTGSFLVRAVVPNPERKLQPGMFVTARVHGTVRPNAVVVPQLAVQQGSNGHLVYVVKEDGTAEVRPVIVGDYYGDKEIVIAEGLKAGDRVVTEGALKVVPGKPVQIVEAGAAKGEAAKGDAAKSGEAKGGETGAKAPKDAGAEAKSKK